MTEKEHKERHRKLHQSLDELLADYLMQHREALPTNINFVEFLKWSFQQSQNPTVPQEEAPIVPHPNVKPS